MALCDDGGPGAAGSFVELGKFQCNGNQRCQHHLQGRKRGLRTAEQHMQPSHTTSSLPSASRSAQDSQSSALLTKGLLWAHSLSSGISDRDAVLRENSKLQWCCCHPPCAVFQPPLHVSTGQVNPKFRLFLSEWGIFSLFVNNGTVSYAQRAHVCWGIENQRIS